MFMSVSSMAYTGVWHLYTNSERRPLGYSSDESSSIDALSRLRGYHCVVTLDISAELVLGRMDNDGSVLTEHILDKCLYNTACENPSNEVCLIEIRSTPHVSCIEKYRRLLFVNGKMPPAMLMDVDLLMMGDTCKDKACFLLFTPFGLAKFRLLCDSVCQSWMEPAHLFRNVNLFPPMTNTAQQRLKRDAGYVVVPVLPRDVSAFPLSLLLRGWERDVNTFKNSLFFERLPQRIDNTQLPMPLVKFLVDSAQKHEQRTLVHEWCINGDYNLKIHHKLIHGSIVSKAGYVSHVSVQYTNTFLESLFPPSVTVRTGHASTDGEAWPSPYAMVGAVLSVAVRYRAMRDHMTHVLRNVSQCTHTITMHRVPSAANAGIQISPVRMEVADTMFRTMINNVTDQLF
jgi:hypothetical protein